MYNDNEVTQEQLNDVTYALEQTLDIVQRIAYANVHSMGTHMVSDIDNDIKNIRKML